MIEIEPEVPDVGCLQALIAYCLTAYLFMAGISLPGAIEQDWIAVLLSPLVFPLLLAAGLIAGGNSEVPIDRIGVIALGFLFLFACFMMALLVQQALKRRWLAWTMGGTWATYMLYALVNSH